MICDGCFGCDKMGMWTKWDVDKNGMWIKLDVGKWDVDKMGCE